MPQSLTEAQQRVLTAIRRVGRDGWPVGVREVMRELGIASPSTVHAHIGALERAGALERNPRGDGWRETLDGEQVA